MAHGIENLLAPLVEKVTIVPPLQLGDAAIEWKIILLGEFFDFGREVGCKFLVRDSAYRRKLLVVGDVVKHSLRPSKYARNVLANKLLPKRLGRARK